MYVYVLVSLKDKHLYIGLSKDPKRRLVDHNSGMTASTKSRRPFQLVYEERCVDMKQARFREKQLKSGSGREFLKKLIFSLV